MANYSAIKAAVNAYIKANGKKEITGRILNSVLNATIDSLGKEFQFAGVLTPADDPGQPDQNVAYIGAAGTYSNFDNLVIESGNIGIFLWNGDWSFETIPVGKDYDNDIQSLTNGLQELSENIQELSDNVIHLDGINEEDLSIPEGGKLQFANRVYNAQQPNGMGYKILRAGKTFAEQVTLANTIYEIRYNFDLGGASVTIPAGCVLKFVGGKLSNGTLVGNNSKIISINSEILPNIIMTGTWNVNCAYPNWFGAKGDNTTDDTNAVRLALYNCVTNNIPLVFPQGYIFYITGTINYFNGEYRDYQINILGKYPAKIGGYAPTRYGGIRLSDNINLFANAVISGSITNMGIYGVRSNNVHFFDKCNLRCFVIENSSIGNIGVFLHDTGLGEVTHVRNNIFLSCFYFHKNTERVTKINDSSISYNYINGGEEPVDNSCFEFADGNGSVIDHNFIDYYRTIFNANNGAASSEITCQMPLSIANEYQVFRYFYNSIKISVLILESIGDVFNWTDPSKLAKLQTYLPITKNVRINNVDIPMELPPYIAFSEKANSIVMRDIKIESNVGIPFYIWKTITDYEIARFELSFSHQKQSYKLSDIVKNNSIYSSGSFRQNKVSIIGIDIITDTLPSLTLGWGNIPNGLTVLCNNIRYTANIIYNPESQSWRFSWVDEFGNEFGKQKLGTTAQRPSAKQLLAGETYFDTTINKMIVWNGTAWVNMDGTSL